MIGRVEEEEDIVRKRREHWDIEGPFVVADSSSSCTGVVARSHCT